MNVTLRRSWSLLCLASGLCLACGFDTTTPAPASAGNAAISGSSSSGGSVAAVGGAAGGSAGAVTVPSGGDAGSAQGGQVVQGGTNAGGGGVSSGGMGVAGGPPAFSSKPLSVVAYSPYRDGQAPGGAQPTKDQV